MKSNFMLLTLMFFIVTSYSQGDTKSYVSVEIDTKYNKNRETKKNELSQEIRQKIYVEIYKWQIPVKNEGIVFGIARSSQEAMKVIRDFYLRNKNKYYQIIDYPKSTKIFKISALVSPGEDIVQSFFNISSKPYKILTKEDLIAIDIYENYDKEKGLLFYHKTNNLSREKSEINFYKILKLYSLYSIDKI